MENFISFDPLKYSASTHFKYTLSRLFTLAPIKGHNSIYSLKVYIYIYWTLPLLIKSKIIVNISSGVFFFKIKE